MDHQIGCLLTDGIVALCGKMVEFHTFVIFNAGNKYWLYIFALVGISRHGSGHLVYSDFRSTYTNGRHRIDRALDTHFAGNTDYLLRRTLFHQICRHPVHGVCQSPFKSNHLVLTFMRRVLWAPRTLSVIETYFRIRHLRTWIHAKVLQCHGVYKWFECRTHLAMA